MNLFATISAFMTNQRLISNIIVILDLIIVINDSHIDCETHIVGFQNKKDKKKLRVLSTVVVYYNVFSLAQMKVSLMVDFFSSDFHMIDDESHCGI